MNKGIRPGDTVLIGQRGEIGTVCERDSFMEPDIWTVRLSMFRHRTVHESLLTACTCPPIAAGGDGPLAECDVHGLPSAAYQQGWDDALDYVRTIGVAAT